jgi:hypothetical protein
VKWADRFGVFRHYSPSRMEELLPVPRGKKQFAILGDLITWKESNYVERINVDL